MSQNRRGLAPLIGVVFTALLAVWVVVIGGTSPGDPGSADSVVTFYSENDTRR